MAATLSHRTVPTRPAKSAPSPAERARREADPFTRAACLRIRPLRKLPKRSPKRSATDVAEQLSARLDRGSLIVPADGNASLGYRLAKRLFDIAGATALLVLLSPVMLTALVVLLVTTGGRPIFAQQRIGYRGRKFWMLKFRTMHLNADRVQAKVENQHDDGPIFKNRRDPRITRVGRWLRRTSVDEMPQLLNVLAGQMSLVGPRPPVEKEVRQYQPWQTWRLSVMPGLTCLWQVSGRSEIGFVDWVRMDLWYLRHQGLWTDLKLLIRTPICVLTGRGAY